MMKVLALAIVIPACTVPVLSSAGGGGSGGGGTHAPDASASTVDASPTDATRATPDAYDADDISRCAADTTIAWRRSDLNKYGVAYTDADATSESFPVSQYRPSLGVPGFESAFTTNVIAIRVRVPATYTSAHYDHTGFIRVTEAPGQQVVGRALCVTAHACDFTPCPYDGDTGPGVTFTVGAPPQQGVVALEPDQVFWINIANRSATGAPSCPPDQPSCGILVDFASPNRY